MSERTRRLKELGIKEDSDGKYIVWKVVTRELKSPTENGVKILYLFDHVITDWSHVFPNTDDTVDCGPGLNVHTTPPPLHVLKAHRTYRLIECRVDPKHIVAVPYGATSWSGEFAYTGGPKFRVRELEVVAVYRQKRNTRSMTWYYELEKMAAGYAYKAAPGFARRIPVLAR